MTHTRNKLIEGVMKPGAPNGKQRPRGRHNNNSSNGGSNNNMGQKRPMMNTRTQTFDSSGPDIRVRGNAHQVMEKYLTMARDATSQGDRVAAENYYQHAEHYFRVINAQQGAGGPPRPRHMPTPAEDQPPVGDEDEQPREGNEAANSDRSDNSDDDGQAQAVNA